MKLRRSLICILCLLLLVACRFGFYKNPESASLSPTFTNTVTITPEIPKPSPTPDFEAMSTLMVAEEKLITNQFQIECKKNGAIDQSPSGKWQIYQCGESSSPDRMMLIENNVGILWSFAFVDFIAFEDRQITGYGNLYPEYWTDDEKYLFFSSYLSVDIHGACFYGIGSNGLFRLNLTDGSINTILPPMPAFGGYLFSFSPDGKQLAFVSNGIILRDLETGSDQKIQTKFPIIGNLTWSPNGSELAYASCISDNPAFEVNTSLIEIYSLEKKSKQPIMETDGNRLTIKNTNNSNQLLFEKKDITNGESNYFLFDWSTRQLVETPMPLN
jgi:hypothetical protein